MLTDLDINIFALPIIICSNYTIVTCGDTGEGASSGGYSSTEEFCEVVIGDDSCSCEYPETWPTRSCLKSCKCCDSGKYALDFN